MNKGLQKRGEQAAYIFSDQFRNEVRDLPPIYTEWMLETGKEVYLDAYKVYIAGLYHKRQEMREAVMHRKASEYNDSEFSILLQIPNVTFYFLSCMSAGLDDAKGEDGIFNILNSVHKHISMKLNTAIGSDTMGENVFVDFSKYHFMLLVGATGTGKSIFHNHLYQELVKQNSPHDIGFYFLDMTRTDFCKWESPYIIDSTIDPLESIKILEKLAATKEDINRHRFVHIEECDMFQSFTERTENAVHAILRNRLDITIIYSTSRPGGNALRDSLLALVDVKVVFQLASKEDSQYVLGNPEDTPTGWSKIVVTDSARVFLQPYTEVEVGSLQEFKLS